MNLRNRIASSSADVGRRWARTFAGSVLAGLVLASCGSSVSTAPNASPNTSVSGIDAAAGLGDASARGDERAAGGGLDDGQGPSSLDAPPGDESPPGPGPSEAGASADDGASSSGGGSIPSSAASPGGPPGSQGGATIYRDDATAPAVFAAGELDRAMQARGFAVTEAPLAQMSGTGDPVRVVVAVSTPSLVAQLQAQGAAAVGSLGPQAFAIRVIRSGATTWYWALGGDAAGAMYGGLEIGDRVRLDGLAAVVGGDHAPYVENRGIKFNIPLDVRTPSYSDDGDAAWNNVEVMWDITFWQAFLDDLARYRYNALSIWSLGPFPSMVKVPGYEDVSLSDVKKNTIVFGSDLVGVGMAPAAVLSAAVTVKTMTIDQKIAFWQEVMQYAKDRGIDFYVFTWNVFTFGTQGLHGITPSQTNPATIAYVRAAVHQMLVTYPLLAGIGVTAGEAMTNPGKEAWTYQTYGLGVKDALATQPGRSFRLINRLNQTSVGAVGSAFASYSGNRDYSFKYAQAHMYSSPSPHFIDATLASVPAGTKTWLEVRNDDIYLARWGDPEYARSYITNLPPASRIAGFFMGPDGYIWGREFVSTEPDTPRQPIIRKQWYSFMLWGRLAFDPTVAASDFSKTVALRFPEVDGTALFDAWSSVSKILPLVTRFHWSNNQLDYQWYPEACIGQTYHDIESFIADGTFAGSNIMDIPSYTAAIAAGTATTGMTPLDVAAQLQSYAAVALQKIGGMNPGTDKELRLTLGDIAATAALGQYYAEKILGATNLSLYRKQGDATKKAAAVQHLTAAATFWRSYAKQSTTQYKPQILTRMKQTPVDMNALTSSVDNDVTIAGK